VEHTARGDGLSDPHEGFLSGGTSQVQFSPVSETDYPSLGGSRVRIAPPPPQSKIAIPSRLSLPGPAVPEAARSALISLGVLEPWRPAPV
jgi:hypothetical protein